MKEELILLSNYDSGDPDTSMIGKPNGAFFEKWGKIIINPVKRVGASL